MKVTKYLLAALTIAALLATAGWIVRNSLIERFSRSLLSQYDIEIVDISLDALATDNARIGFLELVYAKGTTIVIENLTLPINTPQDRFDRYSAERVSITTETRNDEAPFELALLLDQVLSLTSTIPRTDIHISEFRMDTYPAVRDLSWSLAETEQTMAGVVESIEFSLVAKSVDATNHEISLLLPDQAGVVENRVVGKLQQGNRGISLSGNGTIDLPDMEDFLKLAGIVPDEITLRSGEAQLVFSVEAPYDVTQSPSVTASLIPVSSWHIDSIRESGNSTNLRITSDRPIEIAATFPAVTWSMRVPQVSMFVTDGEWRDVPVLLEQLICEDGPQCSTEAAITWAAAKLPFGNAGKIELRTSLQVAVTESRTAILLHPDATLTLQNLSTAATTIDHFEARLVSAANLEVLDNGWQFEADSMDTGIQSMSAGDSVVMSAAVYLEAIKVADQLQNFSATVGIYAPAISAVLEQQTVALPGLRGSVTVLGTDILSELSTVGLQQDGSVEVQQNTGSGNGSIRIESTAVSFASRKMSNRISPWPYDWDLIAGVVGFSGRASWATNDGQLALKGEASITVEKAAGFYADTAITGLSSTLEVAYENSTGFTTKPSRLSASLVDMGLPLENISADYHLDLNSLAAEIDNLRLTAFGGTVRIDPFSFHTDRDSNNLTLRAELIQLDQVLSLKEFEAISVTGSVGALLPVTIEQGKVTIAGGHLIGDAPGGVIRYRGAGAPDPTGRSSMDLVTRALSNFVYETLTSDVDYNEAGDLVLKMQLKGRNPDMDGNRPVVLNLSVENNVPQMIRSLQAARAVEEILERRVKQ